MGAASVPKGQLENHRATRALGRVKALKTYSLQRCSRQEGGKGKELPQTGLEPPPAFNLSGCVAAAGVVSTS